MSSFAQKTYQHLMQLVQNDEAFFYKDFSLEDKLYRIFNYRLASWTSFLAPGALNCRGIMYEVSGEPQLVSLPPEKFFNYEEGGVDHTAARLGDQMVKMDGSLISTYLHQGQLYLKSKGSLFSQQANDAMKFLNAQANQAFKEQLHALVKMGYTANLEYTSPENRIVVAYQQESLTLLSVRSHADGQNFFASRLVKMLQDLQMNVLLEHMVSFVSLHEQAISQQEFVDLIRQEQQGEGYVIEFINPQGQSYLAKVKNILYVTLHQTKESVNSPRRLFEAVIEEATDDLRSIFSQDAYVLDKIAQMEQLVQPIFNNIVNTVEQFHAANKDLARKDYAIKAKAEIPQFMGLAMNLYLGHAVDYKEFAKKHRRDMFNISEEEVADEE